MKHGKPRSSSSDSLRAKVRGLLERHPGHTTKWYAARAGVPVSDALVKVGECRVGRWYPIPRRGWWTLDRLAEAIL